MKSISLYSYEHSDTYSLNFCSRASDSAPLIVNCAGNFTSEFPFSTVNELGREDYYLLHVTKGALTVRFPDGECRAAAGDTVIFPPKYKYSYRYEGDGDGISYLWSHFTGSHAEFYLSRLGFFPLPSLRVSHSDAHVGSLFRSMFDIYLREDSFREHDLAALLLQILSHLAQAASNSSKAPLMRSVAYINSSYTEQIPIPRLAAMENLSNSRYHVVFKQVTGKSPSEYITGLRMLHACELLSGTDMPVKQIGILVGYSDSHFFSKIFKKNLGVSPTEYRKDR